MQVTPLWYYRYRNKQNWEWETAYGQSLYVTHDCYFTIARKEDRWFIKAYTHIRGDHPLHNAALNSGLLSVEFERRIDAVHALESLYAQVAAT